MAARGRSMGFRTPSNRWIDSLAVVVKCRVVSAPAPMLRKIELVTFQTRVMAVIQIEAGVASVFVMGSIIACCVRRDS